MPIGDMLAAANAGLNATAGVMLVLGLRAIRRGDRSLHRRRMITAFVISCVFLISYVTRVFLSGTHKYPSGAPFRSFYFVVLVTHVTLAAIVPFLAVRTLWLAERRQDFFRHRRIARVTWPIWMYVSITGVIVYLMLYHVAGV